MIKAAFIAVSAIVPVLPAFALQAGLPAQSARRNGRKSRRPFESSGTPTTWARAV